MLHSIVTFEIKNEIINYTQRDFSVVFNLSVPLTHPVLWYKIILLRYKLLFVWKNSRRCLNIVTQAVNLVTRRFNKLVRNLH